MKSTMRRLVLQLINHYVMGGEQMKIRAKIAGLVLAAATALAGTASAQDWAPDGPLMFQIGFGAGGSTDAMGRVIAKVMEEQTGFSN